MLQCSFWPCGASPREAVTRPCTGGFSSQRPSTDPKADSSGHFCQMAPLRRPSFRAGRPTVRTSDWHPGQVPQTCTPPARDVDCAG